MGVSRSSRNITFIPRSFHSKVHVHQMDPWTQRVRRSLPSNGRKRVPLFEQDGSAATSLHEIVKNAVDASMNEFILKFDHAAYYRALKAVVARKGAAI